MTRADHRFVFKDVDRCRARTARLQSLHQRAFGYDPSAAGIDDQRVGFHAREVFSRDDAARLSGERQMEAQNIAFREEGASVLRDFVAGLPRARQRTLSTPAHYASAERAPGLRDQAADAAVDVDAERFSLHGNSHGRLPVALFEPLHFIGDVSQRGENKAPGKLSGWVRSSESRSEEHTSELSHHQN